MTRYAGALALFLSTLGVAHPARAAEPEKRPVPDYDGRGNPQPPGRKALWLPRILLSPAYFVSEYLLRRPLGFAITAAEQAKLPTVLYDFFVFGPDHKAGIVPIAFIDFGFQPSVGLYAFWDDAGFEGHDLRLRGSTWGKSWLSGTLTERFHPSDRLELTLSATATRRPDYAFYGIGPDTREADLVRYSADTVDAHFESRVAFGDSSLLDTAIGYRGASFGPTDYDAANRGLPGYEPSLEEAVAAGELAEPPGFRDGYRAPYARARLVLDSRPRQDPDSGVRVSESGLRLELLGEQGADLKNTPTSGWLRYGGTLGGFLDLAQRGRVISLSLTGLLSDPVGERPVPFTELVTLGGAGMMPGFRAGRLHGRSAMVATLRYSWPIWIWLNGSLQAATGNVFDEHFSGMRPERSRFSAAVGIESSGSRDSIFQALVGFGTETFESGAQLDSIRIVVGARNGF
jgi:hypothetical protein